MCVEMYEEKDGYYVYHGEVELADINSVENMLEHKIEFIKRNEPYAKITIADLEHALYVIGDLVNDIE